MRPPSGIYPGEHSYLIGGKADIQYKATGEYRPPRRGEYYLSGAIICAYRALNDLETSYWIAVAGKVTTHTTVTWEALTK